MKVLVVLTQPPLPDGGAPGKCAIGLIRGLMTHGADVKAVAARQSWAAPGDVPADLPVDVVDLPPRPLPRLRRQVERIRRPLGELARADFAAHVRNAALDADVIHLEQTETAWCDQGLSIPSAVHLHYLLRWDRSLGKPWTHGFRYGVESDLAERAAIKRHHYLIASSPQIAQEIKRRSPGAEVALAPLSLDPTYYPGAPLNGQIAGIIGTAAWPATASAMRRLVADIWPRVRQRNLDSRLLIAGRGTHAFEDLEGANVEVLGEVPSASAFIRGLSLLIYPATRGSGMKVKVLEALASGVPVVTTAIGAEGIVANEGVVVHEEDQDLAEAATRMLGSERERKERGEAARRAFLDHYTPAVAVRPLIDLYERMLSRG